MSEWKPPDRPTSRPGSSPDEHAENPAERCVARFAAGSLTHEQLAAVFSAVPADVTFVDSEGIVRYYSDYRIFSRTPECLDRDVLECHSPSTRAGVARLVEELRDGWREEAVFLTQKDGRPVSVRYLAVRNGSGEYLGCLEFAYWADEAEGVVSP